MQGLTPTRNAFHPSRRAGFTLLELMVVLAIVGLASAAATLALRDGSADALARDAERLAALLEAARAQSRASGVPVRWRPTPSGFAFDGLPATATPSANGWLDANTLVADATPVLLGPDPILPAQAVVLRPRAGTSPALRVATDGLRPFAVGPLTP